MPKKPAVKKVVPVFKVGDLVEIGKFGPGEIIELRGNLGPKGAMVYRIVYKRRPSESYLEALGEQLKPFKGDKRPEHLEPIPEEFRRDY